MKVKPTQLVSLGLAFLIGVTAGVLVQKQHDVGHLVDAWRLGDPPLLAPPPTLAVEDNELESFQGKLSLFILAGQSNRYGYPSGWG